MLSTNTQPTILRPSLENSEWYMGLLFSYLVCPEIGAESMAIIDVKGSLTFPPPPHIHKREDELFWTRSAMRFYVGPDVIEVPAGCLVFMPRGVPHAFESLEDSASGCYAITVPGAFSRFFRAFGEPANAMCLPEVAPQPYKDIQRVLTIGAEFGVQFLPPGVFPAQAPTSSSTRMAVGNPNLIEPLQLQGMELRILVDAAQSDGALTAFTVDGKPDDGPPMHIHHDADEAMILFEGTMDFLTPEGRQPMVPGEVVYIPKGCPETYVITGEQTAKLLVIQSPGGGCAFFRDAASCTSFEELLGIAESHRIGVVLP